MQLPTITINADEKVVVTRMLPGLGQVVVQRGQQVRALDLVARAKSPSRYNAINVARHLGKLTLDMDNVMRKKVGQVVKPGEVIAVRKTSFREKVVYAPEKGRIVSINHGWVLLETERKETRVQAFVDGTVSRIISNRGVVIESLGAVIHAACGFGGEAYGLLKRMVDKPNETLDIEAIDAHAQHTIILAGQSVDEDILRQAETHQVRGIIVGSIDAALLDVASTMNLSVVATEGFGDIPMSAYTFGILRGLTGRDISIRGVTPSLQTTDAHLLNHYHPPIILASTGKTRAISAFDEEVSSNNDLQVGSRVRVTRGQFLGAITHIDSFPTQPQPTEAGIVTPGAYLDIEQALRYIPLTNLEQVR